MTPEEVTRQAMVVEETISVATAAFETAFRAMLQGGHNMHSFDVFSGNDGNVYSILLVLADEQAIGELAERIGGEALEPFDPSKASS